VKRKEGIKRLETSTLLSAPAWAEQTFGEVRLGHRSRQERALSMAAAIASDPAACLPTPMGSEAALHAASRFLQTPPISDEPLMRPHLPQTREEMGPHKRVLLIQDTSEVDSEHHPTTRGLGPSGNGSPHGLLLQTVLAVEASTPEVLAIAHQEAFLRQPAAKGESQRQREQGECESPLGEPGVQAIAQAAPEGQWIPVGDRYRELFPFLLLSRQMHCDFVLPAAQDRGLDLLGEQADAPPPARWQHKRSPEQQSPSKSAQLFELLRGGQAMGKQELDWQASKQSKARVAHLAISWGRWRLWPPRRQQSAGGRARLLWLGRVWEAAPPEGVEALEWLLLTWVPAGTLEQACERVDCYRARWMVEDSHQGIKTGCGIEGRQLQSDEAWRRLLGLLAPLARRLLQLRARARPSPQVPTSQRLPADGVAVVAAKAGVPAAQWSTQQCWHTIARFGGSLGGKGDGPAGWQSLWKGWFSLQALLEGVHLAAQLPFDLDST
jgi:Transposase DNA-binding